MTLSADVRSPASDAFVPQHDTMSVMGAIYARRAVRQFTPDPVPATAIQALLAAAVQAPTAIHEEPWAFVVIQDRNLLDALSEAVVARLAAEEVTFPLHTGESRPDTDIFHGAGTLVLICGYPKSRFAAADCWLAAENLMLASVGMGLGTCPIGLAVEVLNTKAWKERLGIPPDVVIHAPVIVGTPARAIAPVPRKPPAILGWIGGTPA